MNLQRFAKRALVAVGVVGLVVSLGTTGVIYKMNRELTRQNQEQTARVKTLTDDVEKLGKRLTASNDQIAGLQSQMAGSQSELEKLKDNVDAFATQAAACDTLRRTIKGGA
ncbi:hypothetical protein [Burkholderia contaminans]|uniref:hypothetical protein n=1 Tax=Burkholderia contaminans TaxID=488447 RepID=UPI003D67058F